MYVYPHGNVEALQQILAASRHKHRRALIVTDGLFSMDGDVAPLPAIIEIARLHNAWTYVDDAHAVGVLGANGRGTAEAFGITSGVDITIGTLGKAFGVAGAFACGSRILKRHLVNHARSFVFSTAMLPAQAAAARESLRIVSSEGDRRDRLSNNAARLRHGIARLGIPVPGSADAHVVPILIGGTTETVQIGAELRMMGLLVGAVRPPTVAEGTSRLRISVSAAHTHAHIERLVLALGTLVART
jgi:7-keto-8-aminopelargonate synthetase-like enzyme